MQRPKVAFFALSCCEGCQLQVANLGEGLIDLLERVELVEFRELMSERWPGRYDIAFVEGSLVNQESEQLLLDIRARSRLLVAFGSCATIGGVNGMKNCMPMADVQAAVYRERASWFPTTRTRPLHQLVAVDYYLHGCPIYLDEFIKVLKAALGGLPYLAPNYAVCVECLINENVCMYEKGAACLGPLTRAGCNSWCINHGNVCYGCRGLVSNPNQNGATEVMRRYDLDATQIANKMSMYNGAMEQGDG